MPEPSELEVALEQRIELADTVINNHLKAIVMAQGIVRDKRAEKSALKRMLEAIRSEPATNGDLAEEATDDGDQEQSIVIGAIRINGVPVIAGTTTGAIINLLEIHGDGLRLPEIAGKLRYEIQTRSSNPDRVIHNTVLNLRRRRIVERFVDRGTKRYRLSGRQSEPPDLPVNGEGQVCSEQT